MVRSTLTHGIITIAEELNHMKKALYRLEIYYKQSATESEKEVLNFILEHPRTVVEIDIHTLAKKCYCSAATIVRICKKNGFKGFKELKMAVLNDINYTNELTQITFTDQRDHPIEQNVIKILNNNIQAIENMYHLLDFQELERIVHLLFMCKYVYLYGIGASFLVAKDLQQKFERISKKTFLYEDLHMQLVSSTNIDKGDIAIVISYSGLTKEIIDIANNIKQRGGIIIAITKYGSSKLVSLADHHLFVPELEMPLRVGASSSRVSQLCIVDILYNLYLSLEIN